MDRDSDGALVGAVAAASKFYKSIRGPSLFPPACFFLRLNYFLRQKHPNYKITKDVCEKAKQDFIGDLL